MSLDLESIVLGTLFLGAAAWAVRAGWRSVRKTGGCSSCASTGDCPLVQNPEALTELTSRDRSDSCGSQQHGSSDGPEMATMPADSKTL